jgi:hypothetical protein
MICPCGGDPLTTITTLTTRSAILHWFPSSGQSPPIYLVASYCNKCGRKNKQLREIKDE